MKWYCGSIGCDCVIDEDDLEYVEEFPATRETPEEGKTVCPHCGSEDIREWYECATPGCGEEAVEGEDYCQACIDEGE